MSLEGWQIGPYYLERLLKRGGMGEVYLALNVESGENVAFKVSNESASSQPDQERFEEEDFLFRREAMAISSLNHEHILRLLDFDERTVDGKTFTYIVMPYCQDGSFADWLRRHPAPLSLHAVAHVIGQAAEALQYAHDHQIIHRDVKPSNFLIVENPQRPNRPDLLLSDFGIAKMSSAVATTSTFPRGSTAYMAPEHWEGHPRPATDQYALAIMTYELLTGQLPFQGAPGQIMHQHFYSQAKPPGTLNPQVPAAVDIVVQRGMEKKPEDRYPSIIAFARAFRQALPRVPGKPGVYTGTGQRRPALGQRADITVQRKEQRRELLERKKPLARRTPLERRPARREASTDGFVDLPAEPAVLPEPRPLPLPAADRVPLEEDLFAGEEPFFPQRYRPDSSAFDEDIFDEPFPLQRRRSRPDLGMQAPNQGERPRYSRPERVFIDDPLDEPLPREFQAPQLRSSRPDWGTVDRTPPRLSQRLQPTSGRIKVPVPRQNKEQNNRRLERLLGLLLILVAIIVFFYLLSLIYAR
ncbi:MAG: serine/threonine protein kinase [Ktedonobacteraceae bacterium]|nr:serine/threonine protein kinase [Ktedonobacteraceae bacterium]